MVTFNKMHIHLLNPCLTGTRLGGNRSSTAGPPATLLLALQFSSSSEPLLASFKGLTSKGFGSRRTAQAEAVVSSFSRAHKVLASWGVLFCFPVIHAVPSEMLPAFVGGIEASRTALAVQQEGQWKVDTSSSVRTGELKIQLWSGILYQFPFSAEHGHCLYDWSARFNPALKGFFFFSFLAILLQLFWFFLVLQSSGSSLSFLRSYFPAASYNYNNNVLHQNSVCVAWKFAFFFIRKCGTFWVSSVSLHEERLRLLLAQLFWKPWASWRLGQPRPCCVGANPSGGTSAVQKDVPCARSCLNSLEPRVCLGEPPLPRAPGWVPVSPCWRRLSWLQEEPSDSRAGGTAEKSVCEIQTERWGGNHPGQCFHQRYLVSRCGYRNTSSASLTVFCTSLGVLVFIVSFKTVALRWGVVCTTHLPDYLYI